MNKIIKQLLIIILISISCLNAQIKFDQQKVSSENFMNSEIHAVDARPMLDKFDKENGINPANILNEYRLQKSTNKTAWNFVVGTPRNFWALDNRPNPPSQFYSVPATCRAVGIKCYIFVEDSMWTGAEPRVDQSAIDAVKNAFDNSTPANANKGIFDTNVETFGNTPDVDLDPKVIILILNIRDTYGISGSTGYYAGYFHSYNEGTATFSNKMEMFYIDCKPMDLKKVSGSASLQTALSTLAHEFQHMIHWVNIPSSEKFLNEGWSLVAEVINGYPLYSQAFFLSETNHYLLDFRDPSDPKVLNDYSRAARFALYLKEQFGTTILKNYLANKINGITGLNTYWTSIGSTKNFASIVTDFWLANFLNENVGGTHPEWVYAHTPLTKVTPNTIFTNPNLTNQTTNGVYKLSSEYLSFVSVKDLKITFNTSVNGNLKIKAIKIGTSGKVIEDVTSGVQYIPTGLGTTYSSVSFMVYHNNNSDGFLGPFVYSFTSSGTQVNTVTEIAYDTTEPIGVYPLSVGDTIAVRFDGISGTRLDSIRVALRNTVGMQGGVWKAGSSTFVSQKLAGPFTVTGKTTPGVPYPVPWPNWIKYDLRSQSIDATNSFIVGFIIDGVYVNSASPTNRVMHTSIPGTSPYHSYTYLNNSSSGTPGWYYIGDGTNISLYLIRAYVSSGPTGINDPIEILPSSFSLEQNYPNPFNPETVISFKIPVSSNVQIKIYDSLGREIRTLIDEFRNAGKQNIYWNSTDNFGKRVSSGVYYYTITAGKNVETKKMVLLK